MPKAAKISISATRNPRSPIRLTTNAFLPAAAATGFSNQNEISRYELSPTSSHPTNSTPKLSPSTRISIEAMNRLR